jgi:hypothetical protein
VGKSWLSCALAQKACRDGYTVHYARVPRLFADLDLTHGDGRFARLFRMLVKVDCQSAPNRDPGSASKRDPTFLRFERLALAPSELVGVAETASAGWRVIVSSALEAPAVIAGLDDVAVVGQAIE